MAWPVDISSAGCHSQITLVPCRGVNSLTYDLLTNQGVVSSRAVPIYCDLLRLSSYRFFMFTLCYGSAFSILDLAYLLQFPGLIRYQRFLRLEFLYLYISVYPSISLSFSLSVSLFLSLSFSLSLFLFSFSLFLLWTFTFCFASTFSYIT